jgi:hypothetical protein
LAYWLVTENVVKITTALTDFGEGGVSLSINLIRSKGFTYSGEFYNLNNGDFSRKAKADLFSNSMNELLMGSWEENYNGDLYEFSWIAIIKKSKK